MHKATAKPISMIEPAIYQIEVQGALDPSWAPEYGNFCIEHRQSKDHGVVTTLTGQVRDQAALAGLLGLTFMLCMPLLSVALRDHDRDLQRT